MAVTVTFDFPRVEGLHRGSSQRGLGVISGSIAFDNSYPTGGEDISDVTDKFKSCLQIICECSKGYVFEYDKTNEKLLVYYADYDAVADGALIQVADEADLSGITGAKFIALGY